MHVLKLDLAKRLRAHQCVVVRTFTAASTPLCLLFIPSPCPVTDGVTPPGAATAEEEACACAQLAGGRDCGRASCQAHRGWHQASQGLVQPTRRQRQHCSGAHRCAAVTLSGLVKRLWL